MRAYIRHRHDEDRNASKASTPPMNAVCSGTILQCHYEN